MGYEDSKKPHLGSDSPDSLRRKIRLGWIGLFTWLFIFSNAIRLAWNAPVPAIIAGFTLNVTMVTFFIVYIRKDYKKLREQEEKDSRK